MFCAMSGFSFVLMTSVFSSSHVAIALEAFCFFFYDFQQDILKLFGSLCQSNINNSLLLKHSNFSCVLLNCIFFQADSNHLLY